MDYNLGIPLPDWLVRPYMRGLQEVSDMGETCLEACSCRVWKVLLHELYLECTCYECGTAQLPERYSEQDEE